MCSPSPRISLGGGGEGRNSPSAPWYTISNPARPWMFPVFALTWWHQDCKELIYLLTNLSCPEQGCAFYARRFHIETFCSDQKGRGFGFDKSHNCDPARLERPMIAACLAYYWIVCLGVAVRNNRWASTIHRTDRWYPSLFRLRLHLLDHLLATGRQHSGTFSMGL
jgi:hypothetical protein